MNHKTKSLGKAVLLSAVTAAFLPASLYAKTQTSVGKVEFRNADDFRYVQPGQTGTFQTDFLKIGNVQPTGKIELRSLTPDLLDVSEEGNWSAKKEGVAYVTADWQYSAESIEALKKQDPDWKDIRPEIVESVAIYISGIGSVYRLYNPNTGEHLYTSDLNEKTVLAQAGWSYESISWLNAADSSAPIYRLYNPNAGDHHYTQEKKEADYLEKQGWLLDGTVLNADSEDQIPVYRLYNPNAKSGAHHFTTDKAEYAWLAAQGWKEEGIAFYTSSADRLPKDDLPLPALPE